MCRLLALSLAVATLHACAAEDDPAPRLGIAADDVTGTRRLVGTYDPEHGDVVLVADFIAAVDASELWLDGVAIVDERAELGPDLALGDVLVLTASGDREMELHLESAAASPTQFRTPYTFFW